MNANQRQRIGAALESTRVTSGTTHNFYLYPARFSPDVARAVLSSLSEPGDWVMDPFMGGGTAVIEGLTLGRSVIGVDINPLAQFVAKVRTMPLSEADHSNIVDWAQDASSRPDQSATAALPQMANLPRSFEAFVASALSRSEKLAYPRQRAFARAVLLRFGQWALDCRDVLVPTVRRMRQELPAIATEMLAGLDTFVLACRSAGVSKKLITSRRRVLCRSAVGLQTDPELKDLRRKVKLVFTSPPYPCVHVLYHRWQVRGRRETSAPFWIAQVPDGRYGSYYTGGSRTPHGETTYFSMIRCAFSSVRRMLSPEGTVVQLIGFADIDRQLPRYLAAMREAGYEESVSARGAEGRIGRLVPNRKWYAKLQGQADASSEILLVHRPR